MVIHIRLDGSVEWHIYRKAYKKARWRKVGNRALKVFMEHRAKYPGAHGLVIVP